jgi:hypothetical protein
MGGAVMRNAHPPSHRILIPLELFWMGGGGAAGRQQQCREAGVHETRKCVEFRIAALTILLLISSTAAGRDQFLAEYLVFCRAPWTSIVWSIRT